MNKLARYSRERKAIIDCLNDDRLTSEDISKKTNIKLYKVRMHLKTLRENNVIDREAYWLSQFSYILLYKLIFHGSEKDGNGKGSG